MRAASMIRLAGAGVLVLAAACGRVGFGIESPPDAARADTSLPSDGEVTDANPPPSDSGGIGGCIAPSSAEPLLVVDDTLAGWWSFNGSSPAVDHSATRINGRILGSISVRGAVGDALEFDGVDDVVAIPDTGDPFDFGTGPFSVEAWIQTTDDCSDQKVFVSRYTPTVEWNLSCERGGFATTRARDSTGVIFGAESNTTRIDDGQWHHLAGVRRPDALELWVDGELEARTPVAFNGNFDTDVDVFIGSHGSDGRHIAAVIDEVRLWRRALGAREIARRVAILRPGLRAYYGLEGALDDHGGLSDVGEIGGAVTFAPGRAGDAASFDGSGGQISYSLPDLFSTDYTALVWFQTAGTGQSQMILNREEGGAGAIHLHVQEELLRANVRGPAGSGLGVSYDAVGLTDGCWHQAALVRDGGDGAAGLVALFVDGELAVSNEGVFDSETGAAAAPFVVGYRLVTDPRAFDGLIDEVLIFDRVLTAEEIAGIHTAYGR